MSMTRQRRGASIARLGGAVPTSGTDGGYPWSDGEYLYAADLNAALSSLFSPGYLPIPGGHLTGPLQLAADPTLGSGAATKSYVDAAVSGVTGAATALNNIGRNVLHNPLFNVAQRGAGPFTTGGYTLDRWVSNFSLDTVSVIQGAVNDGGRTAIGDEAATFTFSNTFTGNAGAGAYNRAIQNIENVRRLAGKTVTVSFWAVAASGTPSLGIGVSQYFGTGGSPSAQVNTNGVAVPITSSWARYSATLAIPSIIGKTLGTNNDHATEFSIWYSSGTTQATRAGSIGVQSGTINIWGVQLEIGTQATPLEKPDPRYDLSNCQRFFSAGNVQLNAYNTAGGPCGYAAPFAVQMRAVPTVTPTGTGGANYTAFSFVAASATSWLLTFSASATGPASWAGTYTASADL